MSIPFAPPPPPQPENSPPPPPPPPPPEVPAEKVYPFGNKFDIVEIDGAGISVPGDPPPPSAPPDPPGAVIVTVFGLDQNGDDTLLSIVTSFPDPYKDTKLLTGVVRYFIVVGPPVPPILARSPRGLPPVLVPLPPKAVIIVIVAF
jgi:hypothetical protein